MTPKRRVMGKNARIVGAAFVVVVVLIFLSAWTFTNQRPTFRGVTDSFRYGGRVEYNGDVQVTVSTDWHDPKALQTYIAANVRRGEQLIAEGTRGLVPVQITFARPVQIDGVRTLVEETGLQVESLALVGYTSLTNQRSVYIRFDSLEEDLPGRVPTDPPGTGDEVVIQGLMVLQGSVPANQGGLGKWLNNPDVYLVDTSELEAIAVVQGRHGREVQDRQIEIVVETPFWSLDW